MSQENMGAGDPLGMLRKMWGNMGLNLPGMVVPTFDCEELEKRISDLKAVEAWLSMNLSMLQMTIRSMEMQNATLRTVKVMGEMASNAAEGGQAKTDATGKEAGAEAQIWPLMLMQQLQEYMKRQAEAATEAKDEIKAKTAQATEAAARKKSAK